MELQNLTTYIHDILQKNVKITHNQRIIVVYDTLCPLALSLQEAYVLSLQGYGYEVYDFASKTEEQWKTFLYTLHKGDLVILIQSGSFRISAYRIRLELNNRGIFVLEHVRLAFIKPEEYQTYVDSLTYDFPYYERVSRTLIDRLAKAKQVTIISNNGSQLIYEGPFEEPKSNIADFSTILGTMFPVGEVFTEPMNLDAINGTVQACITPNLDHKTVVLEKPFTITVVHGALIAHDGPPEFEHIVQLLKKENTEGRIFLREMGFGLNRFISQAHSLTDITAQERMVGYHISLGMKHNVYRKKYSRRTLQKYHIDFFVYLDKILIDDDVVFEHGNYVL